MAGDSDRNRSLKEALLESLAAVLSPEQSTRQAGEEQVKALEVTEEFGIHLAEFTVDPQSSLAVRQLASVLLKQYVESHWSAASEKFRKPETSEMAKSTIRKMLPVGLKEPHSKVRSSVAYAISAIAYWDWPEAWPDLFNILMEALRSGDGNAVHGAMRVLTEFCREVSDTQMSHVAPVILPEMFKIFTQAQTYTIRTRGRSVDIFNTCVNMIASINEHQRGIAKQILFPVLPQFTEAFVQSLQVPDGPLSDSGLKMEVLKGITALIKNFPSTMSKWFPQILPSVWNTLTQSADIYVKTVVNNTEDAVDPVDEDGEILGFETLVYSVFEFIHAMIETSKFRSTVKKSMDQLFYYLLFYMQITEDEVTSWMSNPDQFVQDEDEDTFSYSVRISAQDLLLALAEEFPKEAGLAISGSVSRRLEEAEQSKNNSSPHWWKIHESLLLALGSIKSLVVQLVQKNSLAFDLNGFLQNVVLADLNHNVSPFLLGRCLWAASRYVEVLSPELLQRFLEATVTGIDQSQLPSVRISAVRSIYGFCDHLKSSENTQILQPYISRMMEGLLAIATQFNTEVLALVMEALYVVLGVDHQFTASYEQRITPLTIAVFIKYSSDPLVVSLAEDIFNVLSQNPGCRDAVQQRLIPTLVSIMGASVDKIPMGMQSVALDILQSLVRGSGPPLSDALMNQAFPACVQCTLSTDDNGAMQSGGEATRAYVSCSLEQVTAWQDGEGKNGVYYVVQIISKLLDPKVPEFTATFIGRLVILLISKLGTQLGENLDLILRAVLSKLQQAESLSVIQSLVLVFAHLMHSQMEAVLDFLYSVPDPMGKPALEFVMNEWVSKQHLFYGAFESKVSSVALAKLILHTIQKNDSRLQNIEVKGDQIHTSDSIKTRSKSKLVPDQWTSIPLLVKMYKLLINELSNQIESNTTAKGFRDDEDEEDEDAEGWESDGESSDMVGQDDVLAILGSGFGGFKDTVDDSDITDDPDNASDPISQIDLQSYLGEFIQQLSQQPCYAMFSQHHNEQEKIVLRTVGVPV